MTKTEARAQAKALRKNLDLHAIGAAMAQQLFALPAWRHAGTVFCFVSMRDEPDTTTCSRGGTGFWSPAAAAPSPHWSRAHWP